MSKTATEQQQTYLVNRRLKAKLYLGGLCVSCNMSNNLEFDHIDPNNKSFEISHAIAKHMAWDKLVAELSKCQLLCKPCHIIKTGLDLCYDTSIYNFICPVCDKSFTRLKRQINGVRTFCSRSCSATFYGGMAQR